MIKFRAPRESDRPTIEQWIERDPSHKGLSSDLLMTGDGKASVYVIEDEEGPTIFVRQEAEGETTRLHTQFPPTDHRRVIDSLMDAFPLVASDAKKKGFKAITFESNSIALLRFMLRFGFHVEARLAL